MIYLVTEYLNINRILLLGIGLWPYQQSKFVQLQVALFYSVLISIILVQSATFLTTDCTSDFTTKILSEMAYLFFYVIQYNSFWINNQTVRYLLDQIQYIYNELKDEDEIAIVESYGCKAKRYTALLTLLGTFSLILAVVQSWMPLFLNAFLYINATLPYASLLVTTEYFVDKEKYLSLILMHLNVVFCVGTITLIGTGTMFVACIKCICAIFKIVSYRIEKAMKINIAQTVDLENGIMIYNGIIYAVDIHCKATMLIKFFMSNFEGSLFCMLMCVIICLSLNLFEISQFILFGGTIEKLIMHVIIIYVILLYIFIFNYFAQEILDHNSQVFITVYNTRWYMAPLYIQKMILFLLQRGTKNISLNIGGLFEGSLEGTAALISSSMSYFTVLCSTQH